MSKSLVWIVCARCLSTKAKGPKIEKLGFKSDHQLVTMKKACWKIRVK